MKIALVAPVEESVPPKAYGGTELVVYNLCKELVELGHQVTLLAAGDSKTSATLVSIVDESLRSHPGSDFDAMRERYKWIATGKCIELLEDGDFDIVHNHFGWRLLPFARRFAQKMVTTTHSPLDVTAQQIVMEPYADYNYISISMSQRKGMPQLHYVGNAYNGIDVESFHLGKDDGGYLAFLGRLSPEKGPLEAIKVAKATGQKLKLAGKVDHVDQAYFDTVIKPHIDGEQIEFIGEVNHQQKDAFLGGASAFLMPIHWEEPFGLVVVEAMACGVPVLALRRGSIPELVIDGKTGYVCKTLEELTRRVADVPAISRETCRQHVRDNFSMRGMANAHVAIYEEVAKQFHGA